jgi:hypothetical protein
MMGKHLGRAVVFATDTRVSAYRPDGRRGRSPSFDGLPKLFPTTIGLMVGTGGVALLDGLRERLQEETVRHTGEILRAIRLSREAVADDEALEGGGAEFVLKTTGWLLSFRVEGPEPSLYLAAYHPALGHGLGVYGPGDGIVQLPGVDDAAMPMRNALSDDLQARLLALPVCGEDELVADAVARTAAMMRAWIEEASTLIDTISPSCQVGWHDLASNQTFASEILQPAESSPMIAVPQHSYSRGACAAL